MPNNLDMNTYQAQAYSTVIYKKNGFIIASLGLAGEAGEFVEKVKKILRDKNGKLTTADREFLMLELGDVLWKVAVLARMLKFNLGYVAVRNLLKLRKRQQEGKISGNEDER
jgi:NTP pyrophosphatase (non-canonical NTP hydrolase)